MVRNVTTALVAALVLGSAGNASARAPSIELMAVAAKTIWACGQMTAFGAAVLPEV